MSIYTSRYANRELEKEGYYPVGISLGKPKYPLRYLVRDHCYALAPKGYMLQMKFEPYKRAYFEKLNGIGVDRIIGIVKGLERKAEAEGKKLVLLCFEDVRSEGEWCHRTLFAEWWKDQLGEDITELPDPTQPKKPRLAMQQTTQQPVRNAESGTRYEQMSLF